MARCNDCNKFRGTVAETPEVESIEIEGEGADRQVKVEVRLYLNCDDCGAEMLTTTAEDYHAADYEAFEGHELEIESIDVEAVEEGEGRKRTIGARVEYEIRCECQATEAAPLVSESIDVAGVPASDFEEV